MKLQINSLIPPGQIYRPVDEFELELLRDSISEHGLLQPLVVCGDHIVDGYRRWLVCKGEGWTEIECNVVEGDPETLRIICQTCNAEVDLKGRKMIVSHFLEREPEATAAEIAHTYKWPVVEVEKLVCINALIPEARRMYDAGDLLLSTAWFLARVNDKGQLDLLRDGPLETLHERAEAQLREVKHTRRRAFGTKPRMKSYPAVEKELDKPRYAGEKLIEYDCKTPLDGWLAALRWVIEKK